MWITKLDFEFNKNQTEAYNSAIETIKEWSHTQKNVTSVKLIFNVRNSNVEGNLPRVIIVRTNTRRVYLYQLIISFAVHSEKTGKILNKGSIFEREETIETQVRQAYLRKINWNSWSYNPDKSIIIKGENQK